jgi:hypothetical protein
MEDLEKIEGSVGDELLKVFKEMPQAKTDFVLRELVIGQHETIEQQYAHCILELRMAYNALRRAKIGLEKTDYEVAELKAKDEDGDKMAGFDWREKLIDKYEAECAVIGKLREFSCLYKIYQSFPKKFTREEVNEAQPEYWNKRAIRQANQDVIAIGRVQQGNQDLLRQLGKGVAPELDHVMDIERQYIEGEESNTRLMVAIAVEKHLTEEEQKTFKARCIENLIVPSGIQWKIYIAHGRTVAAAYNDIAMEFMKHGGDYLLTVEDDTFPPEDAVVRLLKHIADGKKVVGAWYPMRNVTGDGVPISIQKDKSTGKNTRMHLDADGEVHEVYTLPMGCTLYSAEVFFKLKQPFFQTTDTISQDSFFSQKLRNAGYKLYCDTSIKCKHVDRETGRVYEYQERNNGSN